MKKVSISPCALAKAKQQAYSVRDKIKSEFFGEIYYSKNEFLDLWASCLGYKNWGEFNAITLNANSLCKNTILITQESAESLASGLSRNSFNPQADQLSLLHIIHQAMSPEERASYPSRLLQEVSETYEWHQNEPFKLSLGYSGYTNTLGELLLNDGMVLELELSRLNTFLLDHAKNTRKALNLNKKEAAERYLDIFPKSGMTVDRILKGAIEAGLIEVVIDYSGANPKECVKLTDEAIQYYALLFTDDYSKEWGQWRREFEKEWLNSDRQKYSYVNLKLMWEFQKGFSPLDSVNNYSIPAEDYSEISEDTTSKIGSDVRSRLNSIRLTWKDTVKAQTNANIDDEHFFYFTPKIHLPGIPSSLKNIRLLSFTATTDTGEALAIPEFELRKPFPNKDWIVAGGKEHTNVGVYCKIPKGAQTISKNLQWEVEITKVVYVVNHTILINLIYIPGNRFFSISEANNFTLNDPLCLRKPSHFQVHSFLGAKAITGCATNNEQYMSIPRIAHKGFYSNLKGNVFTIRDEISVGSSIPSKTSYELGY